MYAALATLAFLATLWLVNLVICDLLDRGLGKIAAALNGCSALATAPAMRPVAARISQRSRVTRALHVQLLLRADLRAAA
jgi:hypothetical protein